MRAPVDHIAAPPFPSSGIAVGQRRRLAAAWPSSRGRPCWSSSGTSAGRNSIRTLPYVKAWHERYADRRPARDRRARRRVRALAGPRRGASAPWSGWGSPTRWRSTPSSSCGSIYGNLGWPARYLFDQRGRLFDYHYGEGGYAETEQAIQELLGVEQPLLAPLRPEDAPDARLEPQTDDVEGPYSGPYEAGGVWAVLDGSGTVTRQRPRRIAVDHPGATS